MSNLSVDWTIFGYYGGEAHRNKGGEMWQTWYTVNDFGDLVPNRAWLGEAISMLHESIPVERDCFRTVVRLNVKGWVN